jgi:hypothetical protein
MLALGMKFDVGVTIPTSDCAYQSAYYSGYIDLDKSIYHVNKNIKKNIDAL